MSLTDAEIANLPLEERCTHSFWKARSNYCEEVEKILSKANNGADCFADYVVQLKNILENEKIVVVREKALSALNVFVDRYKFAKKHISFLAPLIANSAECLGGRASIQSLSIKVLLTMVEIDTPEPVVDSLLAATSNRVAKVVSTAISVITSILKSFGIQFFPTKKVMTASIAWFEHPDAAVRKETSELIQILGHWIGVKVMEKHISGLRPTQVKDLMTLLNALPAEPPKATSVLRSQANLPKKEEPAKKETTATTHVTEDVTPDNDAKFTDLPITDILAKIDSSQFYELIASQKWTDRKEQLEWLIPLLDVPRLKNGSYTQLGAALQKGLQDVNVKVVELASKAIALLCRGLRGGFSSTAIWIIPTILEKFKEKKVNVVTALQEALLFMYPNCVNLPEIMETLGAISKNKVPQVKEQMLRFLAPAMGRTPKPILVKQLVALTKILLPLLDDGDGKVRECACFALGRLQAQVGEDALMKHLEKVDKSKLQKINDASKIIEEPANTSFSGSSSVMTESRPVHQERMEASPNQMEMPTTERKKPAENNNRTPYEKKSSPQINDNDGVRGRQYGFEDKSDPRATKRSKSQEIIGNPAKQFAKKRADLDQTDDIEVIMCALQEMKLIIQKNGISAVNLATDISTLITCLNDNAEVSKVKSGVLLVLMEIHGLIKNEIWQYMRNASPKNKALLESRLGKEEIAKKPDIRTKTPSEARSLQKVSPSLSSAYSKGKDNITDLLNSDHIEVSPFAAFNEIEINSFDIEEVFSEMSHGEPIKSINKLSSYIKDNQNEAIEHINRMVMIVGGYLGSFNSQSDKFQTAYTSLLKEIVSSDKFIAQISSEAISILFSRIFQILASLGESEESLKAKFNFVLVSILEKSQILVCVDILLELLSGALKQQKKYMPIVLKCLSFSTKRIQNEKLDQYDFSASLKLIYHFLEDFPSTYFKNKSESAPLFCVQSIFVELVKKKQSAILNDFAEMSMTTEINPKSSMITYLTFLLQQDGSKVNIPEILKEKQDMLQQRNKIEKQKEDQKKQEQNQLERERAELQRLEQKSIEQRIKAQEMSRKDQEEADKTKLEDLKFEQARFEQNRIDQQQKRELQRQEQQKLLLQKQQQQQQILLQQQQLKQQQLEKLSKEPYPIQISDENKYQNEEIMIKEKRLSEIEAEPMKVMSTFVTVPISSVNSLRERMANLQKRETK